MNNDSLIETLADELEAASGGWDFNDVAANMRRTHGDDVYVRAFDLYNTRTSIEPMGI